MKYFKISNTQTITNTCSNINWNEFSRCGRLKPSFWSSRVEVHFDTNPPHPPLPTPTNSSLPHLLLVLGPAWQQLAITSWHQSPWIHPSCSSACTSDPCALATIMSVYIVNPRSQLIKSPSKKSLHSSASTLHSNPSSTSWCHVYFPAH